MLVLTAAAMHATVSPLSRPMGSSQRYEHMPTRSAFCASLLLVQAQPWALPAPSASVPQNCAFITPLTPSNRPLHVLAKARD